MHVQLIYTYASVPTQSVKRSWGRRYSIQLDVILQESGLKKILNYVENNYVREFVYVNREYRNLARVAYIDALSLIDMIMSVPSWRRSPTAKKIIETINKSLIYVEHVGSDVIYKLPKSYNEKLSMVLDTYGRFFGSPETMNAYGNADGAFVYQVYNDENFNVVANIAFVLCGSKT
jgi:hypothetical protein